MGDERKLKEAAEGAFRAALAAADPEPRVAEWLDANPGKVRPRGSLHVIAVGKASAGMVRGAARSRRLDPGRVLAVTRAGHAEGLPEGVAEVREAGHPVPDRDSLAAGEAILDRVAKLGPDDELLLLISGGASALAEALPEGIRPKDWFAANHALVGGGLPISAINAVRKHCSRLKGGQLARAAAPATVTALIVSDVIGDDPAVIGSGPAAGDPSTFAEALAAVEGLEDFPDALRRFLERGRAGALAETPEPGDVSNAGNAVVVHNRMALAGAERYLAERAFRTLVLSSRIRGEAREVARVLGAIGRECREGGRPAAPPAALLWGGETTVALGASPGEGGRSQEMALALAPDLAGGSAMGALCAGTDGTDGPTDAAGGWVDGATLQRAESLGVDVRRALAGHDSGSLLARLDDRLVTGPTGTNVMDIGILLVG